MIISQLIKIAMLTVLSIRLPEGRHCFSDILPIGRVIFSLRESDIETNGFSDIIFAYKLAKRITLCEAQ